MQRLAFVLLAAFIMTATLALVATRSTPPLVRAATYPAGWSLIAGPAGAQVTGASGPLYTLQPGDSDYEVVPAGTALKACVGYWAYFPAGGSLTAPSGARSCTVTLAAGQWSMVGNPSATDAATVSGADVVYVYSPATGYQQTATLPPGQGAWASGAGEALVAAVPGTAPAPNPSPTTAAQVTATASGCASGSCSFNGDGTMTLTFSQEGLQIPFNTQFSFRLTVAAGVVSGEGQQTTTYTVPGSVQSSCSFPSPSGPISVSGTLTGTTLHLSFATSGPRTRIICLGQTLPASIFPATNLLFNPVDVEARDGATGTTSLIKSMPLARFFSSGALQVTLHAAT